LPGIRILKNYRLRYEIRNVWDKNQEFYIIKIARFFGGLFVLSITC
jgi:hypothetical protein